MSSAADNPSRLYKYRALTPHTEAIFTKNHLYFASPSSFNDPFDCLFRLVFDAKRKAKKKKYFEYLVSNLGWSRSKARLEAARLFDSMSNQELDAWEKERGREFLAARNRIGVFCLSAVDDDVLMWSHYADCHRGICLEFRLAHTAHVDFFAGATRVRYQEDLPVVNPYEMDRLEMMRACLLTKSSRWAYEQEWRNIDMNAYGNREFPRGLLSRVILGACMCANDRSRVLDWISHHNASISVCQAELRDDRYGLQIRPL